MSGNEGAVGRLIAVGLTLSQLVSKDFDETTWIPGDSVLWSALVVPLLEDDSMPEHPFSDDLVTTIANERSVDLEQLRTALEDVQREFERDDGKYEYSTQHNYGWKDDQAYYFYGSEDVWQTVQQDLSLSDELTDATRHVHERAMLQSASRRGEEQTVRGMFDDGNEPLVVINLDGGPARFGQDV